MKHLTDYTEVEIRSMPAGSEMDRLVSEALDYIQCGAWRPLNPWMMHKPGYCEHRRCRPIGDAPKYSTDRLLAVPALIDTGLPWMLHDNPEESPEWRYEAGLGEADNDLQRPFYHGSPDFARNVAIVILLSKLDESSK